MQLGPVMSGLHLESQGFRKHKENAGDAEHSGAQQRRGGREEGYGRLSIATLVLSTPDPLPLLCLVRSANHCVLQWCQMMPLRLMRKHALSLRTRGAMNMTRRQLRIPSSIDMS
jgi:hypothetical protein